RGHFRSNEIYQRLTGEDDRYKMEIQIAQQKKALRAVTYSYKSTVFYGKADADGSVDFPAKKVLLRELKILEVRMAAGDACIMTCYLQYSKLGDEEFMEGTYTSMNTRDSTDCGKGSIFLHKVPTTDFYKEPFLLKKEKELAEKKSNPAPAPVVATKKNPATPGSAKKSSSSTAAAAPKTPSPVKKNTTVATAAAGSKKTGTGTTSKPMPKKELTKVDPNKHSVMETAPKDSITISHIERKSMPLAIPKVLSSRTNELVRTITVNTPDVVLNIYDDGTIDNDTVSVYFDNKVVVSNARLTEQPIVVKLHLDESSDVHEVIMVAENLGDIPPNTSLMVVKAGDKRYEVRIVSDELKNAVVQFKYQKPQ
ncbi:MAG TPA: hypothetical protein VMI35_03590, partial [Puia sp.]|nr:hypothetical protein [Puia sp.]